MSIRCVESRATVIHLDRALFSPPTEAVRLPLARPCENRKVVNPMWITVGSYQAISVESA